MAKAPAKPKAKAPARPRKPRAVPAAPAGADPEPHRDCIACNKPMDGRFCQTCGYDSRPRRRRLRELLADLFDNVFSVTGQVPLTSWALIRHPQMLVQGLRDGDTRFPSPFKLYLTASAVFFLFLAVSGVSIFQVRVHRIPNVPPTIVEYTNGLQAQGYWLQELYLHPATSAPRDPELVRALTEAKARLVNPNFKVSIEFVRRLADDPAWLNEDIAEWGPRALWLLMPLYALLLWPLFKAPYTTDHFIFAVWAHTTLYLLLILGAVWNMVGLQFGLWVALAMYQAYLTVGLKAYYQASWSGAAAKGVVHSALYGVLCWLPVIAIFLVAQIVRLMQA